MNFYNSPGEEGFGEVVGRDKSGGGRKLGGVFCDEAALGHDSVQSPLE